MATTEAENRVTTSRVHDELIEGGNVELVAELYTEDAVIHGAPGGNLQGRDEIREHFASTFNSLTPKRVSEDIVISDGDYVTVRRTDTYTHVGELFGSEPTGEEITFSVNVIARIEDGKVAEAWLASPMVELLTQLGVVEVPADGGD